MWCVFQAHQRCLHALTSKQASGVIKFMLGAFKQGAWVDRDISPYTQSLDSYRIHTDTRGRALHTGARVVRFSMCYRSYMPAPFCTGISVYTLQY